MSESKIATPLFVSEELPLRLHDPRLLAHNMFWLAGGELISRLIGFVVAVYLARVLGAKGYGAIGVAFATVSYLLIVVDMGLDPYGTREVARDPRRLPSILSKIVWFRLLLATCAYGLLVAMVHWVPAKSIGGRELALVYGARLFVFALRSDWAVRGREAMSVVAVGLLIQHLVYAAGIFLLVRGPQTSLVLVPAVYVSAEFILSLWYLLWLRRHHSRLRGVVDGARRRQMVRESWPVGLAKALRLTYYEGDMLLIAWLSVPQQVGYFLVSHKIILSLVALALLYQQNAFPALSRLVAADLPRSIHFQHKVSRFALLFSMPIAVGGALISRPLIQAFFGKEYQPSAAIFATMLFTLPLVVVTAGLSNHLLASGYSRFFLNSVALGTVVHVALGLWWIPKWSGLGAARASLLGECSTVLVGAYYLWQKQRAFPLCQRSLSIVAAGCLMALVMFYFRTLPVFLVALAGCLVYTAVVLGLGGVRPEELRFLWQRERFNQR